MMTAANPGTFASPWPADPLSAWAEGVRAPEPLRRPTDPPELGSPDTIADRFEDHRSLLPLLALVCAMVGAIVLSGLLIGILPLGGADDQKAALQWTGGIALLIVSVVLWIARIVQKRNARGRTLPAASAVLCELYLTKFHIHDGDGYTGTCVAIDASTSDDQAARLHAAFRIWIDRLEADRDAGNKARDDLWQPITTSGAGGRTRRVVPNVVAAEEIFGPAATGGYLVRRPNLPAHGWGLLLTRRTPAYVAGRLAFALVLRSEGGNWRF